MASALTWTPTSSPSTPPTCDTSAAAKERRIVLQTHLTTPGVVWEHIHITNFFIFSYFISRIQNTARLGTLGDLASMTKFAVNGSSIVFEADDTFNFNSVITKCVAQLPSSRPFMYSETSTRSRISSSLRGCAASTFTTSGTRTVPSSHCLMSSSSSQVRTTSPSRSSRLKRGVYMQDSDHPVPADIRRRVPK